MTTFWLRATDEYSMVSCADRRVVVLHPGAACLYDDSAAHKAIVAEVRAGTSPLELVESDSDPSLAPPPLDEPELERELAEHNAMVKTRAHQRLLAADAPPMPGSPLEGWSVTPTAETPPPVPEIRRLKPEEIPSDLDITTTKEHDDDA